MTLNNCPRRWGYHAIVEHNKHSWRFWNKGWCQCLGAISLEIFCGNGWKHIKPPRNCSHKYNIFAIKLFGNIWTSHLGLFSLVLSIYD
jgi:hypothetical protein